MGVVFLADQREPVARRVALKIVKPELNSRQVLARFEAERQTLALMDHPNIAKVLDAGTTVSGRPYFVMELIEGARITEYVQQQIAENTLVGLREVLQLRPVTGAGRVSMACVDLYLHVAFQFKPLATEPHEMSSPCHLLWLVLLLSLTASARADIYRWDNNTFIPGTEGITPGPGVELNHRELVYAQLNNLDLAGARFDFSDLRFAHLHESNLVGANLSGANLTGAALSSTTLTGADFSGAVVMAANFYATTGHSPGFGGGFTKEQLYSTASYQAKDLRGIGLSENELSGWNFSGQDMEGAWLRESNLTSANLRGANLANALLRDSSLDGANLSGANLTGAILSPTTLAGADLSRANLAGASLGGNLTDANLSGANLAGTDLSFSTLAGVNLSGAVVLRANFRNTTAQGFTAEQLYSTNSYQVKDLRGIHLALNDLRGWGFSGQNLADAILQSDLANADLSATNLANANLENSSLANANLSGANLAGANLSKANLMNTDFLGAVVTLAGFSDTTSRGFTKEQFYSTASYEAQDLRGIVLGENNLSGWDFSGQNMANAHLWGAMLNGADFTGAVMAGVSFGSAATSRGFTQEQFYSTASYEAKDVKGITLEESDLSGWDLSGQDLAGAWLRRSKLAGANLSGANLAGARLDHVDLSGANLKNAHLAGSTRNIWFSGPPTFDADTVYNQWTIFPSDFNPDWIRFGLILTPSPAGDLDANDVLDLVDVDWLARRIAGREILHWWLPDAAFDLNGDGLVSLDDHRFWVKELKPTWFGDADLDGQFNSADLVSVFQTGEYEDAIEVNSTWATGDWNGDGEFTTSDLVIAFQDGGYEQGPRLAVATVPEPSSVVLIVCGALVMLTRARVVVGES